MAVDSMSFGSIEVDDRKDVRSDAVGLSGLVTGEARGERMFGMMTTSGSSVASAGVTSGVVAATPKRDGGWGDVGEGIVKVAVTALAESLSGRRSPSFGRIDVRLVGVGGALMVYDALIWTGLGSRELVHEVGGAGGSNRSSSVDCRSEGTRSLGIDWVVVVDASASL